MKAFNQFTALVAAWLAAGSGVVCAQSYYVAGSALSADGVDGLFYTYNYNGVNAYQPGYGFASSGQTSDPGNGWSTTDVASATDSQGTSTYENLVVDATLNGQLQDNNSSNASLATATVNVGSSADAGLGGGAKAIAADTLTLNIPGATASTVTLIPITYTVVGSYAEKPGYNPNNGLTTGATTLFFGPGAYTQSFGVDGSESAAGVSGFATSTFLSDTANLVILEGSVAVTGASPQISVYESVGTNLQALTTFDQTANLALDLPAGVTYTSASGVFAVPEPTARRIVGHDHFGRLISQNPSSRSVITLRLGEGRIIKGTRIIPGTTIIHVPSDVTPVPFQAPELGAEASSILN